MIVHGKLRFLIMDAPARENVEEYAIQLNVLGAKHLVRTCEGNYDGSVFESHGIQIHVRVHTGFIFSRRDCAFKDQNFTMA
jgi:hypothetical protein